MVPWYGIWYDPTITPLILVTKVYPSLWLGGRCSGSSPASRGGFSKQYIMVDPCPVLQKPTKRSFQIQKRGFQSYHTDSMHLMLHNKVIVLLLTGILLLLTLAK